MRKIFAILILGIIITTGACADNDAISRNMNDLPVAARNILKKQFAQTKVSYIKIDKDLFKPTTYDVQLVNGTEVSFDSKGNWTEVDGKKSEIPAFFIPSEIKRQVNEMFPEEKITKIEKNSRNYEVELTNGTDLTFDKKFNIREID